jgi:AcrR family transcriptional regulator
MPPKIVDKEKRRKEIINATLEVFSERGYEATSMSQIAKLAGIGKGTIYEYFESKEEIILNAIKTWAEGMAGEVEKQLDGIDDPVERLRNFAHSSMEAFMSDKRIMRLFLAMLEIMLDSEKPYPQLIRETMQGVTKAIADILHDGVSRGIFRPDVLADAGKIAVNFMAYLDGIGVYYYMLKDYINMEDQIDLYLDNLLGSLRMESNNA